MRSPLLVALGAVVCACSCGRIGYAAPLVAADAGAARDAASFDAAPAADAGTDAGTDSGEVAVDSGSDGARVDADAGPPCEEAPCRLVSPQCGCAAGTMCQRTGATSAVRGCIPEGAVAADDECTGDATCAPGMACLTLAPLTTGHCHRYCHGDADCPGTPCASYDETGAGIGICGSTCTPLGGCIGAATCRIVLMYDIDSPGPVVIPMCWALGGAADGAACTGSLDCREGSFCDGVCRRLCDLAGPPCPPGSGTCTAYDPPLVVAGVAWGLCR